MPFQPGANLYTQGFGSRPEDVEVPHIDTRAPNSTDIRYPIGKRWIFTNTAEYVLLSLTTSVGVISANWSLITTIGGDIVTLTGDTGTATPVAGNVQIAGTANQISTVGSAGVVTLSLPAAVVAPGSVAATTTLTATLGNITATNGNFVGSAVGTGLLFNSPTATGAAASPLVLNGRSGQAIFTSVSIAAAADLTLTITNSAITASTTQVIYALSGTTTGSALSIKSVTNSAGSSAIVVTNGTGATTSTSNITLTFLVLNT